MLKKLYPYRFELFLFSQMAILFGSLIVPLGWFESWISPLFFLSNLMAGVVFVSHKRRLYIFLLVLLILSGIIFVLEILGLQIYERLNFVRLACFFAFYGVVSLEIIKQVTNAQDVNKNVILGLISGYISLGLLASMILRSISLGFGIGIFLCFLIY